MFRLKFDLIPLLMLELALVSSLTGISALALESMTTNSKLPTGMFNRPVVFDGQDSIYVLGEQSSSQIFKYSISADQIKAVGQILAVDTRWGSAVWGGRGNIFYFGGFNVSSGADLSQVWGLNADNLSNMTVLGNLPGPSRFTKSFWDGGDKIYVLGHCGTGVGLNTIARFSIASRQVDVAAAAVLPVGVLDPSVVWDTNTRAAVIFGGYTHETGYSSDILKFDPAQGTGTVMKLTDASLPVPTDNTCAVWTGTNAFIVGGKVGTAGGHGWPQLVRFNPSTNQVVQIEAKNFPPKLWGVGCAFVEKLNRIYVLGGYDGEKLHREIRYIDLGPTNETGGLKCLHFNILMLVIVFNYFV